MDPPGLLKTDNYQRAGVCCLRGGDPRSAYLLLVFGESWGNKATTSTLGFVFPSPLLSAHRQESKSQKLNEPQKTRSVKKEIN